jgi:hypothetical protein
LGLLRAAALNLFLPAAPVDPAQRIAVSGDFFVLFAAREVKAERQRVVIPLKNWFFNGLKGRRNPSLLIFIRLKLHQFP